MAITNAQQFRQMFRYGGDTMGGPNDKSSNQGPAGGASSGGNYGGNSSGGVGPNNMSGAGDRKDTAPDPGFQNALRQQQIRQNQITQSQNPDFGQFFGSRVPTYQPLTFGQKIGQGLGSIASGVGNYIKGGGTIGMIARGLGSLFPSVPSTGNVGPAGIKTDGTYGTVEDAIKALLRNQRPTHIPDGGDNIPFWAQLGYPSYDSWLSSQNQSIDNDDETEEGDFKSRFLQNRTPEEREVIEQMINEKFSGEEWDYDSFGLGDMDGS